MLQSPGKGKSGEPELARQMLEDVLLWFPDRKLLLVGDGGYSGRKLLHNLDRRVRYLGLMRSAKRRGTTRREEPSSSTRQAKSRSKERATSAFATRGCQEGRSRQRSLALEKSRGLRF